jgi:hypothetical protein
VQYGHRTVQINASTTDRKKADRKMPFALQILVLKVIKSQPKKANI